MKKLLSVVLCAFLLASLPVVTSSCATTQQQVTYNTLYSVGHAVDSAWAVYAKLLLQGQVPQSSLSVVVPKYRAYQKAYNVALDLAQLNPNAIAPADVTTLANDLLATIEALKRL